MKRLSIAMVAPVWLTVPAQGYGGTEAVVNELCRGLDELGVNVEFFGVEGSTVPARRHHWTSGREQYDHLTDPMYDAAAIPAAHVLECIERIRRRGTFDLIHDHNSIFGPAIFGEYPGLPPVLHTIHGPFSTPARIEQGYVNTDALYSALSRFDRLYFNAISRAQAAQAPVPLRKRIVAAIHHGLDPSTHRSDYPKGDYFVNVGRIAAEKGVHIAAKACAEMGLPLKLAGVVGKRDEAYHHTQVEPWLKDGHVDFLGSVMGEPKDELIGRARAFLMPIQWDEPFGMAVIDALVCGTPVIAMRRGSMPEIIEHGVNGFLADTEEQFRSFMQRAGDIDPAACRRSVEEHFSYQVMAQRYHATYERIIARHATQTAAQKMGDLLGVPAAPALGFYERLKRN